MEARPPTETGSYRFDRFRRSAAELARLKLQATVAIELERAAWRAAGLKPGLRVLDLGCGPGFTSCELARAVGPEGQVTGLDASPALIAAAEQAKASEQTANVSFVQGDVYALDLPADGFDFVHARFLFQHLKDPAQALRNVRRVLKPGGALCILDIDDNWTSFAPASAAFVKFVRRAGAAQRRQGGNRWIGSQLHGLLCAAGFRQVAVRVHPVTTDDLGLRNFLGLAVLFRLEVLTKFQKLLAMPLLRQIKGAAQDPHAWGAVGIFVARGVKPAGDVQEPSAARNSAAQAGMSGTR